MSGGFTVDPDVLTEHAAYARELADALRATSSAARALGIEAYGLIGRPWATAAIAAAARADRAVAGLSETLDTFPDAVRRTADAYRRVEDDIVVALGRIC